MSSLDRRSRSSGVVRTGRRRASAQGPVRTRAQQQRLGTRRGAHEQIGRELILSLIHEVLDQLEVLGLEFLTGSLETIDLVDLILLLARA